MMNFLFVLLLLGVLGVLVGAVWLIVNLIKKRSKKIPTIISAISLIMIIGSSIALNHVDVIDHNQPINTALTISKLRGQGGEYENGTFDMDDTLYDAYIIDSNSAVIINADNTVKGFYVYQSSDAEIYEILEILGFPIDDYLTDFLTDDDENTYTKTYDNYYLQLSEYPGAYGDYYENELSVMFYDED